MDALHTLLTVVRTEELTGAEKKEALISLYKQALYTETLQTLTYIKDAIDELGARLN